MCVEKTRREEGCCKRNGNTPTRQNIAFISLSLNKSCSAVIFSVLLPANWCSSKSVCSCHDTEKPLLSINSTAFWQVSLLNLLLGAITPIRSPFCKGEVLIIFTCYTFNFFWRSDCATSIGDLFVNECI